MHSFASDKVYNIKVMFKIISAQMEDSVVFTHFFRPTAAELLPQLLPVKPFRYVNFNVSIRPSPQFV
jgi:hypothetical protein